MNDELIKVLCMGNICVDIKAYSPESGGTEAYRDGSIEIVSGGVARGMALNLKQLGIDSSISSMVGQDIFGDYLKRELESKKIDTTLLKTSTDRKTALFSVMKNGDDSASCIYNTNIIQEIVFDEETENFLKKEKVKALVLDSNISSETFANIYSYKKNNPDLFIFQNATAPDLAKKTLEYAELVDLFACNEFEAAAILGESVAIPDVTTAEKFQALGYKNFIITFGEQGVLVQVGKDTWIEPPYNPQRIVDTIGAGDAFASGFLMGFLTEEPVKRCIHYGLTCAKETLLTKQTVSNLLSRDYLQNYPVPQD